jgi:tight adherence protein B
MSPMTNYLPLLLCAAGAAIILAICLVVRDLWERWKRWRTRGRTTAEDDAESPTLVETLTQSQKAKGWAARMDQGFADLIRRTMLGVSVHQALGVMVLAGVALATGLYFWRDDYWLAALGLVAGPVLPLTVFLSLQSRWRRQIQAQLPDAFFLLARSLRAGLTIDQALEMVGQQGLAPLADEFRRVTEHLRLGLPVPAALGLMGRRVRLSDFNVLIAVAALYQRMGGNLATLLDRLAIGSRERIQLRGQFRAATALGRLTAVLIALASPVLLLVYWLLQPDYLIRFAQDPRGMTALGVSLVLEVVGVIWIYLLLRGEN